MNKALLALREALLTAGFVPVDATCKAGNVSVICRQMPGQEKVWLSLFEKLLAVADAEGFELHVCRRFVRKDGQMVFGWHLSVTSKAKELSKCVDKLRETLLQFKPLLGGANAPIEANPAQQPTQPAYVRPLAPGQHPAAQSGLRPRAPGVVGRTPPSPATPPKVNVVMSKIDEESGKEVVIQEMPLPNVYKDLNKPTKPVWSERHGKYVGGGKGAKYSA